MAILLVPASFTIFLCVLLLLFTSSSARSPLIDDDSTDHFVFPESDTNNLNGPHAILLPSDSQNSETESEYVSDSVPFTVVTIRPLHPRFPERSFPLSYHFHHRCRHGHPPLQFSDDHDITLYDGGADDTIFDALHHGEARQIPARWTRLDHVEEMTTKPQEQDQSQPQQEEKGVMMKIRKFLNGF